MHAGVGPFLGESLWMTTHDKKIESQMIHMCIDPDCFFEKQQICAIWGINVLLNNSNPE